MHGEGYCCWANGRRVDLQFTHCYPNHVRTAVRVLCGVVLVITLIYVMPHLVDMTNGSSDAPVAGALEEGADYGVVDDDEEWLSDDIDDDEFNRGGRGSSSSGGGGGAGGRGLAGMPDDDSRCSYMLQEVPPVCTCGALPSRRPTNINIS